MRRAEEITARLREANPDALTADGLEDALVGIAERCGQPALAVYDVNRAIRVLVKQGMLQEEAEEYLEFNSVGAWVGPHTPVWLYT